MNPSGFGFLTTFVVEKTPTGPFSLILIGQSLYTDLVVDINRVTIGCFSLLLAVRSAGESMSRKLFIRIEFVNEHIGK